MWARQNAASTEDVGVATLRFREVPPAIIDHLLFEKQKSVYWVVTSVHDCRFLITRRFFA